MWQAASDISRPLNAAARPALPPTPHKPTAIQLAQRLILQGFRGVCPRRVLFQALLRVFVIGDIDLNDGLEELFRGIADVGGRGL